MFLTYPTSGCDSGLKISQRGVCLVTPPAPLRPRSRELQRWGGNPCFCPCWPGLWGSLCFELYACFQVGVSILPIKVEHLLSLYFFSRFTFWKAKQVLEFYAILMKWEIVNVTKVIEKFPKRSWIHEMLRSCETKVPTWLSSSGSARGLVAGSGVSDTPHTVSLGCHGSPERAWGRKALGYNFM